MATNKFKVFDEQGKDMMTDAEYASASQRVSGVVPGLADAEMHNKLYRQCSIMAAAIGRVLGDFDLDAPDDNLVTLANNIESLFCFDILRVYPVGAVYISTSAVNPAQLFGGTWEQISGRFLLAADSSHAAGTTGGEANHTLTASEMPAHNHAGTALTAGSHSHTGTVNSDGTHRHSGTTSSNGTHTHNFLTRTGTGVSSGGQAETESGTGSYNGSMTSAGAHQHTFVTDNGGAHQHSFTSNAAGNHEHILSIGNTGGGLPHNNMPPYLSVYVWKRIA